MTRRSAAITGGLGDQPGSPDRDTRQSWGVASPAVADGGCGVAVRAGGHWLAAGLRVLVVLLVSVAVLGSAGAALADTGPGYAATVYASGFANGSVCGGCGPYGVGFDASHNFYVADISNGGLYRFPSSCALPCPADASHLLATFDTPLGLAFGPDGKLYLAIRGNGLVEVDPSNGSTLRTVVSGTGGIQALVDDPLSGDLFVDYGFGDPHIYRVSNPSSGSNLPQTIYATLPSDPDGLSFTPDGTLWAEAGGDIYMVSGTNTADPGTVTDLGVSIPGADGIAAASNPSDPGHPPFLMVNSNGDPTNGGVIYKVDLSWPASGPPTATVEPVDTVYYHGSRGDFATVGADGCLYATQTDSVIKVTNADGSCSLAPTVEPLTTAKTADSSTAAASGSDGYTITISNPNASAATLSHITDTLPAGFAYTTGSSSGATVNNPARSGQTLSWAGPFTVPARGSVSLHFGVTVSATAGTYYNNAGGDSAGFAVNPTGPTAPITVASANQTLTVTPVGAGAGSVTSDSGGISCTWNGSASSGTCSHSYAQGTQVTLTASPASGSTFTGWSGGGCSGTGNCTVTMSSAQTVAATFAPPQHTLTVLKSGSGAGSVSSSPAGISCGSTCSAHFNSGQQVTLTATPASGSTFAGWSGGGCSGAGACTVTMSSDQSVTATFTTITQTLTVLKAGNGSGSVTSSPAGISCGSTCSAPFNSGQQVTLTDAAASGSSFAGWSVDGSSTACPGTGTCTVAMGSDHAVTANFASIQHTLSVSTSGSGSGTVTSNPAGISCGWSPPSTVTGTCSQGYDQGTVVNLIAKLGSATSVTWGGCASSKQLTCQVTMSQARNVTATFNKTQEQTLTVHIVFACPSDAPPCGAPYPPNQAPQPGAGRVLGLPYTPGVGRDFDCWAPSPTPGYTEPSEFARTCSLPVSVGQVFDLTAAANEYGSGRCSLLFCPGTAWPPWRVRSFSSSSNVSGCTGLGSVCRAKMGPGHNDVTVTLVPADQPPHLAGIGWALKGVPGWPWADSSCQTVSGHADEATCKRPWSFGGAGYDLDHDPHLTYNWNWGDGTADNCPTNVHWWCVGDTMQHSYAKPGTYTITETVTDTDGQTASTTAQITVWPDPYASTTTFSSALGSTIATVPHAGGSATTGLSLPSPATSISATVAPTGFGASIAAVRKLILTKLVERHVKAGAFVLKLRPTNRKLLRQITANMRRAHSHRLRATLTLVIKLTTRKTVRITQHIQLLI